MTQEQARSLFDALVAHRIAATLSFTYHETMLPAENYSVGVSGRSLNPADLQRVVDAAAMHGCGVHLIGGDLLLLPEGRR